MNDEIEVKINECCCFSFFRNYFDTKEEKPKSKIKDSTKLRQSKQINSSINLKINNIHLNDEMLCESKKLTQLLSKNLSNSIITFDSDEIDINFMYQIQIEPEGVEDEIKQMQSQMAQLHAEHNNVNKSKKRIFCDLVMGYLDNQITQEDIVFNLSQDLDYKKILLKPNGEIDDIKTIVNMHCIQSFKKNEFESQDKTYSEIDQSTISIIHFDIDSLQLKDTKLRKIDKTNTKNNIFNQRSISISHNSTAPMLHYYDQTHSPDNNTLNNNNKYSQLKNENDKSPININNK